MKRGWIVGALGALAALVAAPAGACTLVANRPICAPNGECSGPIFEQDVRERAQRAAIEYGRAMAVAVEARRDASGLDRAADVARLVFPLIVNPIDNADGGSCGPEIDDSYGSEDSRAIAAEDFVFEMTTFAGASADWQRSPSAIGALAALRGTCQQEATGAFADYLRSAIPAEQIAEVWDFLLPRAGPLPPADPRERLVGWRFSMTDGSATGITYNNVFAAPHIDGRRERAWQYLQNHRNGRAVMSAVSQFIQSRLSDGRGEAAICPVAHAETQSLIGELAQP